MTTCDLCHCESDRLTVCEDLWGLGASTMCEDSAACSGAWASAFDLGAEPVALLPEPVEATNAADTAVLLYTFTLDSRDKAEPTPTRRIRALTD